MASSIVERFAPSPTGPLHLGHAFSALTAHDAARSADGTFLLRIEDIDATRSRPAFEAAILEDLRWLGLRWREPVLRQSSRREAHSAALDALVARGLVYPCTCTRRDIALAAPQEGAAGPDGLVYPGTCRGRYRGAEPEEPHALRLDIRHAIEALGGDTAMSELTYLEIGSGPAGQTGICALNGPALRQGVGDVALGRKDIGVSYHLAVVLDDAFQGVTHVTRGCDLFGAVPLHRLLQALLDLPVPIWRHHRLIRDETGRRLAKRDNARALAALREAGATPADIRRAVGLAD